MLLIPQAINVVEVYAAITGTVALALVIGEKIRKVRRCAVRAECVKVVDHKRCESIEDQAVTVKITNKSENSLTISWLCFEFRGYIGRNMICHRIGGFERHGPIRYPVTMPGVSAKEFYCFGREVRRHLQPREAQWDDDLIVMLEVAARKPRMLRYTGYARKLIESSSRPWTGVLPA